MLTKKEQRLRRARQTRIRIASQGVARLTVNRTNLHIYASVISGDGGKVIASASTAKPISARNLVPPGRAATLPLHRLSASVLLKKQKRLVWKKWHLTAQVLRTTVESRRWQMLHARLACSSKQIGNKDG